MNIVLGVHFVEHHLKFSCENSYFMVWVWALEPLWGVCVCLLWIILVKWRSGWRVCEHSCKNVWNGLLISKKSLYKVEIENNLVAAETRRGIVNELVLGRSTGCEMMWIKLQRSPSNQGLATFVFPEGLQKWMWSWYILGDCSGAKDQRTCLLLVSLCNSWIITKMVACRTYCFCTSTLPWVLSWKTWILFVPGAEGVWYHDRRNPTSCSNICSNTASRSTRGFSFHL